MDWISEAGLKYTWVGAGVIVIGFSFVAVGAGCLMQDEHSELKSEQKQNNDRMDNFR